MGLFACPLSAPKITLICAVSAPICADPLHCRPSIEYARNSIQEVRTPASPNPLLLTLTLALSLLTASDFSSFDLASARHLGVILAGISLDLAASRHLVGDGALPEGLLEAALGRN